MLNKATRKLVDRSFDQGTELLEKAGDKSAELAKQTGQWVRKNDTTLLGIAALTLGIGVFSYLLTRGRRFVIIL